MEKISIYIPGQPVPKGRPRFYKRGIFISVYTPDKTKKYENLVSDFAKEVMLEKELLTDAINLDLILRFSIPPSWNKSKKNMAEVGEIKHTSKPDIDNVAKSVIDGLNGIVFKDDSQIFKLSILKEYSNFPGVLINIYG